jgi:hypothetical protein
VELAAGFSSPISIKHRLSVFVTSSDPAMHVRAALFSRCAVRFVPNSVLSLSRTFVRRDPDAVPITTFHTLVSVMGGAADDSSSRQRTVLVKVGAGAYSRLVLSKDNLMDRTDILKALTRDEIFANDLKDVPLGQVKLLVLPHVAGEDPTPDEENAAVELKGSKAISSIVPVVGENGVERVTPASNLVLRIELPPQKAMGAFYSSRYLPLA